MTNKDVEKMVDDKVGKAVKSIERSVDGRARAVAEQTFKEVLPEVLAEALPAAVDEWRQRPLSVSYAELRQLPRVGGQQGEQRSPRPRLVSGAWVLVYAPPADFGVPQARPRATVPATGVSVGAGERRILELYPGAVAKVPTGLSIGVPKGYEARLRSASHCLAEGLCMHGGEQHRRPGEVGEITVLLRNDGPEKLAIEPGDPVALLTFAEVPDVDWDGAIDAAIATCAPEKVLPQEQGAQQEFKL